MRSAEYDTGATKLWDITNLSIVELEGEGETEVEGEGETGGEGNGSSGCHGLELLDSNYGSGLSDALVILIVLVFMVAMGKDKHYH